MTKSNILCDKTLNKLGIEENCLTKIKDVCETPQLIAHLMVKDWMLLPKIRNETRVLALAMSI